MKRSNCATATRQRYLGKGVTKAVANINGEIARDLAGQDADQRAVDARMIALDGTPNKARLGANAMLGVSMALARASAAAAGLPLYAHVSQLYPGEGALSLPVPMMNILNGGAHADSSVDFQEFMVMPVGASSFAEGLRAGVEIFHALRAILKAKGHSTGVGDEGGFAPSLSSNREAVDVVLEAVTRAGYTPGGDVYLALDVASSELWNEKTHTYEFKKSGDATRSSDEMVALYEDWVRQYPIISIEDGVAESDWDGWAALTRAIGDRVQLVGDDVFVTNPEILERGIRDGIGNALLVKLNQIGTVTETLDAVKMARDAGLRRRDLAPVRRDGRHDDRRPRRRHGRRTDQDRIGEPERPGREVQPAAPHRGGTGCRGRYAGRAAVRATL